MPVGEEERLEKLVSFDIIVIRNYDELVNNKKVHEQKQRVPINAYPNNNNGSDYQNKDDIMPVVTVDMWEGRTVDQKRQLAEGITASFEKIGVP